MVETCERNDDCKEPLVGSELKQLFGICLEQSYCQFNGEWYEQKEGLAMGAAPSPLGAEVFMDHYEKDYVMTRKHPFLNHIKYWRSYVDDVFVVWEGTSDDAEKFLEFLNSRLAYIQFTLESEVDYKINVLDLTVKRSRIGFEFGIFRKPSSTDLIIRGDSNHPQHKIAALRCFVERLLTTPLLEEEYNKELTAIYHRAKVNGYNKETADRLILQKTTKTTIQEMFPTLARPTNGPEDCKGWISLPFFSQLAMGLQRILVKEGYRVAFKSIKTFKSIFGNGKDRILPQDKSGVYKLTCGNCTTATYCGRTGRKFVTRLKEHLMVDATAKIPDGILEGNFYELGRYDECLGIEGEYSDFSFVGQYCLVDLSFDIPDNLTVEINGQVNTLAFFLGKDTVTFTLGQCIPSTCKPWVVSSAYNDILQLPNQWTNNKYQLNVSIEPSDCHTSADSPLSTAQWVMLAFTIILLVVVAACTVIDMFHVRKTLEQSGGRAPYMSEYLVQSFSAHYNGKRLISMDPSPDAISCLNGIKFLSIVWVFLGHRYRYLLYQPLSNYTALAQLIKQYSKAVIAAGPLSVDSFFLVSGLLNMLGFLKLREKTRSKRVIILEVFTGYVHRYLRLTPSYAFTIAFSAIWIYQLGNGPMWNRIVYGTVTEPCLTGWWKNIIYLNNYLTADYCMMQSWYLSADMQLFWLSPILIYPLWRWPIFGYIETIILTIASIASPLIIAYMNEIPSPIPFNANTTIQYEVMNMEYFPTHTKATSYIIGIFVGYIVYWIREDKINLRFKTKYTILLWLIALIAMSYSIFGGYALYQLDYTYNAALSSFYIGFYRFFWSLGLSWLIIACITGQGGPINDFLSWRGFSPLAKLTYAIYLLHVAVIAVGVGTLRTSYYIMDYPLVQSFLGDLVLTVGFSAVLSLTLEAPLIGVGKLLTGRDRPRRKRTDPEAEAPSAPTNINGGERLEY